MTRRVTGAIRQSGGAGPLQQPAMARRWHPSLGSVIRASASALIFCLACCGQWAASVKDTVIAHTDVPVANQQRLWTVYLNAPTADGSTFALTITWSDGTNYVVQTAVKAPVTWAFYYGQVPAGKTVKTLTATRSPVLPTPETRVLTPIVDAGGSNPPTPPVNLAYRQSDAYYESPEWATYQQISDRYGIGDMECLKAKIDGVRDGQPSRYTAPARCEDPGPQPAWTAPRADAAYPQSNAFWNSQWFRDAYKAPVGAAPHPECIRAVLDGAVEETEQPSRYPLPEWCRLLGWQAEIDFLTRCSDAGGWDCRVTGGN